jgi:hypothetical protein
VGFAKLIGLDSPVANLFPGISYRKWVRPDRAGDRNRAARYRNPRRALTSGGSISSFDAAQHQKTNHLFCLFGISIA